MAVYFSKGDIMKSKITKYAGKYVGKAGATINLVDAIGEVKEAVYHYLDTREKERTRREAIAAAERVAIERIRSHREIICKALDLNFEERDQIFDRLFNKMDEALRNGDTAALNTLTASLTRIATENTIAHIIDTINNIHDPSKEITLGTPPKE